MLPNAPCAETPESPNQRKLYVRNVMAWTWHILYILYSVEVGIFLLFLPWLNIWENNYLVFLYPKLQPVVSNAYFKGAVLGLGIVNIYIGLQEIAYLKAHGRRDFSR